jgi:hypothetical protein
MKNLILTTALVVLTTLMFSQQVNSPLTNDESAVTEQVKCAIFPNSNDLITMIVEKAPGEKLNFRIKESNKQVLYQKRIKNDDKTIVKYDISKFPSGEYKFELVKGKEVLYSKTITKKDAAIVMAD